MKSPSIPKHHETHTHSALARNLPPLPCLPFPMCLPMTFRSPPPIPDIVRPHSRNSQTDQIHFSMLRLQSLCFRTADLSLLELPLACVVRLCGLIDTVCGGNGGDASETCVEDLLWGWLRLRFLSALVIRRGVIVAVVAPGRARGALRA